ncbi:hypothetical protein ACET3X_001643 [Alternaria dauci]|uniref:Uncharacterized protein n=1 Tax=Alternaria dauci TaxID=48095 RepID=A0ABR3UXX2_9PLEO
MKPNTARDLAPPDAKSEPAPENSHAGTADELKSRSCKVADGLKPIHTLFLQDLVPILVLYIVSLFICRHFLVSFFFMLYLGLVAEKRLFDMNENFKKVITSIRLGDDTKTKSSSATMKEYFEGNQAIKDLAQRSLDTVFEFRKASYKSKEAFTQLETIRDIDFLIMCRQANDMRLRYFQVYLGLYGGLVNTIEQIVKHVKAIAQSKVKGTKRNSNNRNGGLQNNLAGPLEDVAADLKQSQWRIKKQVAMAEKIKAMLEREGLVPDEIHRLVKEAEGDIQHPQDTSLPQRPADSNPPSTVVSPPPLSMDMDGRLEKHYEDLDKWFQSLQNRPVVRDEG